MTYISYLREELDLCDLPDMVANMTYNLILPEVTRIPKLITHHQKRETYERGWMLIVTKERANNTVCTFYSSKTIKHLENTVTVDMQTCRRASINILIVPHHPGWCLD